MRKPEHQWETRRFVGVRREVEMGGATQAFELRPRDGGPTRSAVFALERQVIDRAALTEDPDLLYVARAWVAARGGRAVAVFDEQGEIISSGSFTISELSEPAPEPARRVITLAPSNAELVDSLGCFERVIACEDSSDSPPEVARCERLGPDLGPDLDRIAALAPDLVFSSLTVPGMERIVTGLRARGVRQRVLAPRSLDDVITEVALAGTDLGVPDVADAVIRSFEAERAALAAARPSRPARVYLEWWPRPMYTPASRCFSNGLIALAGGINVFGDRAGASVEVSPAELVAADPDVCFVSWCGVALEKLDPDNLIRRPGLESLRAAREGRVFRLDERFAGRPGPRVLEAARIMARAIAELG